MQTRRSFYGWWIATSTFINLFVMVGLIYYGLPIFYTELIKEFHWSRAAVTAPYAISVLLIGPFAGLLIDRYGTRRALLFGVPSAFVAFIGFSYMHSLGAWFLFYFISTVGYMFAGPLPNQVLVSQWFRRMRGRVMGMAYLGLGIGGALAPLLFTWGIRTLGWRQAFYYGAFLILVLLMPIALFVVKQRPQDIGQHPDGDSDPGALAAAPPTAVVSLRDAIRSRSFWLLTGCSFFSIAAVGSVIQHLKLFLVDQHYSSVQAGWVLTCLMVSSIFGRVIMGFAADRFGNKPVMLAAAILVGGSIPLLYLGQVPAAVYAFAVIFGFGMGADYMMIPLMTAECFGVNSLGRVMGFILPIYSVGQAAFPVLVGWMFDRTGSYNSGFAVMTAAGLLAVAAAWLIQPPAKSEVARPAVKP